MLSDRLKFPLVANNIFEIIAVLQLKNGSLFSPRGFIVYRASMQCGLIWLSIACFANAYIQPNDTENMASKLKALAMGTATTQFFMNHTYYTYKLSGIKKILKGTYNLHRVFSLDFEEEFREAEKRCQYFIYILIFVIWINIPVAVIEAILKMHFLGGQHYPFQMACFGASVPLCWFSQLGTVVFGVTFGVGYQCTLKVFVIQLTTYCKALAKTIEQVPMENNDETNRKIQEIYAEICTLVTSLSDIYGFTAIIEVAATSPRGCFAAYHFILAITRHDWKNATTIAATIPVCIVLTYIICTCGQEIIEMKGIVQDGILKSKWYQQSPKSRKFTIELLTKNQAYFKLHFKRVISFDMNTACLVVQRAYTLMTALANVM